MYVDNLISMMKEFDYKKKWKETNYKVFSSYD